MQPYGCNTPKALHILFSCVHSSRFNVIYYDLPFSWRCKLSASISQTSFSRGTIRDLGCQCWIQQNESWATWMKTWRGYVHILKLNPPTCSKRSCTMKGGLISAHSKPAPNICRWIGGNCTAGSQYQLQRCPIQRSFHMSTFTYRHYKSIREELQQTCLLSRSRKTW